MAVNPVDEWKRRADAVVRQSIRASGELTRETRAAYHAAEQLYAHGNPEYVRALTNLVRFPVTIDEFVESEDFLRGAEFEIWPALRDDLRKSNPDVLCGEEPVHEILLGGATGTGKSFLSTGTQAYQIYLLSCFRSPHRLFGLAPSVPIVFMMQHVTPTLTKRVLYGPFRTMFTSMRFARNYLTWDNRKETVLALSNNVHVVPAAATLNSLLGQAIAGAIIDEVNFMAVVENSKQVPGEGGLGGKYDQAEVVYSNISRRRKRSFTTRGVSIGNLCVISSTRYAGDFLDRRIDEVKEHEVPNTLWFRHRQFDVNPRFVEAKHEMFRVLVGSETYPTRVLTADDIPGEHYPENAQVIEVPMPYRSDFMRDPDASLRDVVGIASASITPFIRQRHKIMDAMARAVEAGVKPIVEQDDVDLTNDGMPVWIPENMPNDDLRRRPHFIHGDLSTVGDRCGVAVVRLDGFINRPQPGNPGIYDVVPKLTTVLAVGIKPSIMRPIQIAEVRTWAMQLSTLFGYNIQSFTFDGFGSIEAIQVLRKAGVNSHTVSVDTSTAPYEATRDLLYEDRMDIEPEAHLLRMELSTVEFYAEKNKIDHPPRGTKDVADAVAAAAFACLQSRQVRTAVHTLVQEQLPDEDMQGPPVPVQHVARQRQRQRRARPRRARS